MRLRPLALTFLWIALLLGALAIPAGVIVSIEDGPMPADQLWRKKALAKTILCTGGGVAALAACGLYAMGRATKGDRSIAHGTEHAARKVP
jgi:hypothetical protein